MVCCINIWPIAFEPLTILRTQKHDPNQFASAPNGNIILPPTTDAETHYGVCEMAYKHQTTAIVDGRDAKENPMT